MKNFLFKLLLVFVVFLGIFVYKSQASPTDYWFNNAVDTSPESLGNYWLDAGLTIPAVALPDLSVDNLTIVSGATYEGNASIRGSATNEGTITGNASFYEDASENIGEVQGSKTRYYSTATDPSRDFTSDGPWTIVADGVEVNLDRNGSVYDDDTIFLTMNGGFFTTSVIELTNKTIVTNTITLTYNKELDSDSIPLPASFIATIDSVQVDVIDVEVSGNQVVIILDQAAADRDDVTLTYNYGTYLILDERGLNAASFTDEIITYNAPPAISVGTEPVYATLVGTKLYVSNKLSSSVSVIDTLTDDIVQTIAVGNGPEMSVLVGNKLFVNNLNSGTVSVINTLTDSVTNTITVGTGPYFSTVVGTKIYVSNTGGNTVSVINSNTNTVITTITVGDSPWYLGTIGSKVYVPNRIGNSVSVINTITDTVSSTIAITSSLSGSNAISAGTTMYVGGNNSMYAINTLTDTITSTISVGSIPYFSCRVGTKIYAPNRGSSSVSVINTLTNTVTSTIPVTSNPTTCVVLGSKVYITHDNSTNSTIEVIDTTTDTVTESIAVGFKPFYASVVGHRLYVSNNASGSISVVDTDSIHSKRPHLISFTSSTADGTYTSGQNINITANFGRLLENNSTMTVELNSGAEVELGTVSGKTLSGVYTIGPGENTPDLAVNSVINASVTDLLGNTQTEYEIPSSQGNLVAENSFIQRNIGDSKNIVVGSFYNLTVGSNPYQVSTQIIVNDIPYVYVANQGSNDVTVVRLTDKAVVATISTGTEPYGIVSVTLSGTTYVYVSNTGSNNVTVINTSTNTVAATVPVGVKPYYVAAYGTYVYVTNSQSNTVSVIDANTNTVSATIPVGLYPRGIKAVSGYIYVANYGDPNYTGGNSVSVIDPETHTVSSTIILPSSVDGPRGLTGLGSKVYISNFRSNNVSVINTATNSVVATIPVGMGPRGISPLGTNIYVQNFDGGTISVIDTLTDTVTATVTVGHSPTGLGVSGTDIYVSTFQDNYVSIFNTVSNSLRGVPPVISNIASSVTTPTSATITWITDVASDSLVEYGLDTSYGGSVFLASLETSHSVILPDLQPGRTYHFRITSVDAQTNTVSSSDQTFSMPGGGGGGGIGINHGNINIEPTPVADLEELIGDPDNIPSSLGSRLCPKGISQLPLFSKAINSSLYQRIKGRFTLAVEERGTVWYVHPLNGYRYGVNISSGQCFLESVALGISHNDIEKISKLQENNLLNNIEKRLRGSVLLETESKGETWYVEPSGSRVMITINNLLEVAKRTWIGIRNQDLYAIPEYK
jgi:YVTN family beta-propeller protein